MNQKLKYITTPIYYANAVPHIGHLYTTLLGDSFCRFTELIPNTPRAKLISGVDEHGIKVQQAAEAMKIPPQQFCDGISDKFQILFDKSNIKLHRFVRTTESSHKEAVQKLWQESHTNGFITKGYHEGWYDKKEEAFVPSNVLDQLNGKDLDKSVKEMGLEWISESNYKFLLWKCFDSIKDFLKQPGTIFPSQRASAVMDFEEQKELSISRCSSRVQWAIPVPRDETQSVYVWFDALTNYLTCLGYPLEKHEWDSDVDIIHIVGKDILRFHAIYWIAFLSSVNLRKPSRILCHGHWTKNNTKMSKSVGNVVCPLDLIDTFGVDCARYYLLREGRIDSDCSFSWNFAQERINSELVDTFGNLLSRSSRFATVSTYPEIVDSSLNQIDLDLISSLNSLQSSIVPMYDEFLFSKGLESIMDQLRIVNKYFADREPWVLAKSSNEDDLKVLQNTMYLTFENLRICSILLYPVVPEISLKVLKHLGFDESNLSIDQCFVGAAKSKGVASKKIMLVKRKDCISDKMEPGSN